MRLTEGASTLEGMDTTQLLLTAGSVAGMVLVGLMAIVPTAMETGSDPHDRRPSRSAGLRSRAAATAGPGRGRSGHPG